MSNSLPSFWFWLWRGTGSRPGWRRVVNRWLLFHLLLGFVAAKLVTVELVTVSERALLPLLAILVGLTFSWAGNAHALLQSKEVLITAGQREGGIFEYVYTFQLCILIILTVIVAWVLPLLGLKYVIATNQGLDTFNFGAKIGLYGLLSLAFRSSWQAVLGANMLLLIKARLKQGEGA